jgi:hypothetical protein
MAGPSLAARHAVLSSLALVATHVSLHTADPGVIGGNEAPVVRAPVEWDDPADGTITSSNRPVVAVPAGTYSHYGLWSAADGGTWITGGELLGPDGTPQPERFAGAGTYAFDALTLTHG